VPQIANYLTAPTALFQAGLLEVDSFHRRIGEMRLGAAEDADNGRGNFFWRGMNSHYNYTSNLPATQYGYNANIRYTAMQFGGNLYGFESDNSLWLFGLAGSLGQLSFTPHHPLGSNKTTMDRWNIAGYVSYLNQLGFYVDTVLSYGGFRGTVSSSDYGRGAKLTGNSLTASIEAGMPFVLNDACWSVEPQAQLIYQRLSFGRDVDSSAALPGQAGFLVDLGTPQQWVARLGMRLKKETVTKQGYPATLYGKLNLIHGFGKNDKVWAGNEFKLGKFGTHLETGLGMSVDMSKNSRFYGELAWQERISSAGSSGFRFNSGICVNF